MAERAPSVSLRLVALGGAVATLLVVLTGLLDLGIPHRALSAVALPPLVALAVAAWLDHRSLLPLSLASVALFGAAALVVGPRDLHLALAALAFGAATGATALTLRGRAAPAGPWRDYVTLTKPRIMSLLLVTGIGGMFVGAGGVPGGIDLLVLTVGLALACGGASAFNHVLDADIDRLMGERTQARPVAAGRVTPAHGVEFGLALSAGSFVLLASRLNVLTALLALAGNLFYVVVYTRWLKRSTIQNIVIGGAAGAFPPLVGYAAASGNLTVPALLLFLIVFVWTPPHFWALALLLKEHYANAEVPMLPVVRGDRATVRQIVLYSVLLVAVTATPFLWHTLGVFYLASALALGAIFLHLALRLWRDATRRRAAVLFHYSLLYLALLFLAMAIDPVLA